MQPTILAPASGFSPWALFLREINADISVRRARASDQEREREKGVRKSRDKESKVDGARERQRKSSQNKIATFRVDTRKVV